MGKSLEAGLDGACPGTCGFKEGLREEDERNGVDSEVRKEMVFSGFSHRGWCKE